MVISISVYFHTVIIFRNNCNEKALKLRKYQALVTHTHTYKKSNPIRQVLALNYIYRFLHIYKDSCS